MKPPIAAALSYARYLRSRYRMVGKKILDVLEVRHTGRITDAGPGDVTRKIVRLYEEHPIDPEYVRSTGKKVDRKNAKTLKTIGVKTTDIASQADVDAFRDNNLALIKKLDDQSVSQLREILETADKEAWTVDRLREQVIDRLGVTESHADLIARDQVLKLNAQLTETRQTAVGITHYIWSTSGDERVREPKEGKVGPNHAILDGTIQSWASPPVTNEANGDRNHPGEDYQCRCVAIPIVD